MTSTSGDTRAPPRFLLRTLGTLRLVGPGDDTVLGDHGHQRRRLALLAVLAASGDQGRSRDQLLGLFWPEVSQSRARHSLEQLLYAIRTSLGESIFAGMNPLRLNDAVLASDVGAFAGALAGGELETAAELYRGKFLDGFYLNDAPEFERWMDAERKRVERGYSEALEQLAKTAERDNDWAAAARWRQKLIETDPVSSKHATGLIRALVNGGDHASALKYAERYEAILGQELGTSVGPAVAELVAEVRARAKTESVVVRSAAPSAAIQRPIVSSAPSRPEQVDSERGAVPPIEAEPIRARSTRRLSVTAVYSFLIAAFLLTVVVVAALRMRPWRSGGSVAGTGAGGPSIAVLPLASVGADPRDAALAAGLSEELLGMIAKIHRLRVVGSTSAAVFKNSRLDARRIADSLGVSNVFEGSVQRDGQRIRVQVRLVDARDGSTRWSDTYNRELKDIFLVQSDIANAIARELDLRVGGGTVDELRRPPTDNIAAYELYLRGNDPVLLRSDSGARLGLEYFKQAIALDSTFAGAYAGLAQLYLRLLQSQRAAIPARDLYVLADAAARKAVALDDSLPAAHDMVGVVRMAQYDLAEAEKELTRAVALDPGDRRVSQQLARLYAWKERPVDALSYANHAVEVDPLSPSPHVELARALCANGKYTEGLAELKRLESVRPPVLRVALFTSQCHAMNRDWPAAVAALQQWRENRGRGFLAYSLARGGQRQEALAVMADLTNHWQQTKQGAFEVAVAYAGLGDHDRAFEWIDRSFDDFSLNEWIMLPLFDDLHADPRFERLRKRLLHHNL